MGERVDAVAAVFQALLAPTLTGVRVLCGCVCCGGGRALAGIACRHRGRTQDSGFRILPSVRSSSSRQQREPWQGWRLLPSLKPPAVMCGLLFALRS